MSQLFSSLVSTQWLADHLGADDLVVLDATVTPVAGGFTSGIDAHLVGGHLPGARFACLLEEFSDPAGRFGFARPDASRFARAARELGVDDGSTVVVYDAAAGQWAARLWWLFRSYGFERVAVLDGGLGAWHAEGRAIEFGYTVPPTAGQLTLVERPDAWVDAAEVERISRGEAAGRLVCSLPRAEFVGEAGPRPRNGHIPASANVPFGSLRDRESGRYREGDALAAALAPALEGDPERVVLYCASGIAASGTALALTLAGFDDVAVYDGGLNEWVADADRPVLAPAASTA
ncbi:sulfurtransferase [Agromyces seonyuensis]|nr:rhodanese-like domain-containing protein [Agromyces seonyuensis]